jgi:hypothetical protein
MTDLTLRALGAKPVPYAAVPTLNIELAIEETTGASIESLALRCQLRIEPQRRTYSQAEEQSLVELFGESPRWGDTLKPFLWTHVSTVVPRFTGFVRVELPVACTYDFEVAAAKYLHALQDGEVPLVLLFSGSVFARGANGLEVTPLPWNKESTFRMPIAAWRELMNLYYPGTGWLRLERGTLDGLLRFKARRALPTFDQALLALLRTAGEEIA